MLKDFRRSWREHFHSTIRIVNFIATVALLIAMLFFMSDFLIYIEMRDGFVFTDPLLNLFEPFDVTNYLFILMYGMILIALIYQVLHPNQFSLLIRAYFILLLFRALSMFMLPLESPMTMIPLADPFIEYFGNGQTLTNDLFFSGHTATSFLLFLTMQNRILKPLFLVICILMASFVLLQHVHYTIDVVAAPFFAYGSFKISKFFQENYY